MRAITLRLMLVVAVFGLFGVSLAAQDKTNEELQKEALDLNNIRSEEAINNKIKELGDDKKYARKLVRAAATLLNKKAAEKKDDAKKEEAKKDEPKADESVFTYSGAHILGMVAGDVREYKASIDFLLIAIEKANKVKSVRKLCWNRIALIETYLADNKPVDAEKVALKLINTNPNNIEDEEDGQVLGTTKFLAANDLVRALMQQGKFDDAQKQVDKLYKLVEAGQYGGPAKSFIQSSHAQLLTYKGELKDAIKMYEMIVDETESPDRKERLREVIGNLEADAGNIDKAVEVLTAQLKKKPDQPGINNDLGYILAVNDRQLDEAYKMIKKAVDAEPENSSFLDSMAWVLYKQKKFKEAKEYIMKAVVQERGKNTEIMEHLGDIQMALNEKEEAKKSYQAAVAAITFNYKDQQRKPELEKKLKSLGDK